MTSPPKNSIKAKKTLGVPQIGAEAPKRVALTGLQKVCKAYGRMKCGDTMMAWDYQNNVAIPEAELHQDKARWAASERAKYASLRP